MNIRTSTYPIAGALCAALGLSAAAVGAPFKTSPEKLDKRLVSAQERLENLQAKKGKRIPNVVLKNARGIIIMHKLKLGLGIGAQAGGGVALVKDQGKDTWRPPAFVGAAEASWGLQIGAQDSDIVIVLMSEKSLNFLKPLRSTEVGFEANATAGPVDVGKELDTDTLKSHVLVYSDSAGAFAGATLKAGGIIGAKIKNMTYHGATMQEVLFGNKGEMTPQAKQLIASIERAAGVEPKAAAK